MIFGRQYPPANSPYRQVQLYRYRASGYT